MKAYRMDKGTALHVLTLYTKWIWVKVKGEKVMCSLYRTGVAQRVGRVVALLFHDRCTRRAWVVSVTPRPPLPPGKTRYPFYRRLGGPQGRSDRGENLVTTGIRSRTVQPVASRYNDWATGPTSLSMYLWISAMKVMTVLRPTHVYLQFKW